MHTREKVLHKLRCLAHKGVPHVPSQGVRMDVLCTDMALSAMSPEEQAACKERQATHEEPMAQLLTKLGAPSIQVPGLHTYFILHVSYFDAWSELLCSLCSWVHVLSGSCKSTGSIRMSREHPPYVKPWRHLESHGHFESHPTLIMSSRGHTYHYHVVLMASASHF